MRCMKALVSVKVRNLEVLQVLNNGSGPEGHGK